MFVCSVEDGCSKKQNKSPGTRLAHFCFVYINAKVYIKFWPKDYIKNSLLKWTDTNIGRRYWAHLQLFIQRYSIPARISSLLAPVRAPTTAASRRYIHFFGSLLIPLLPFAIEWSDFPSQSAFSPSGKIAPKLSFWDDSKKQCQFRLILTLNPLSRVYCITAPRLSKSWGLRAWSGHQ